MDREKKDFEFESYVSYHGDASEVKKAIENCPTCGKKLILSHFPDTGNLLVHENAKCISCNFSRRKLIHKLN